MLRLPWSETTAGDACTGGRRAPPRSAHFGVKNSRKFVDRGQYGNQVAEVRVDAVASRTGSESLPQHLQRVRSVDVPARNVQSSKMAAKILVRSRDNCIPRERAVMKSRGGSGLGSEVSVKHVGAIHVEFLRGPRGGVPPGSITCCKSSGISAGKL